MLWLRTCKSKALSEILLLNYILGNAYGIVCHLPLTESTTSKKNIPKKPYTTKKHRSQSWQDKWHLLSGGISISYYYLISGRPSPLWLLPPKIHEVILTFIKIKTLPGMNICKNCDPPQFSTDAITWRTKCEQSLSLENLCPQQANETTFFQEYILSACLRSRRQKCMWQ